MKISVIRERRAHEKRVALTPDLVKKIKSLSPNICVVVEQAAGESAAYDDAIYRAAGAEVTDLNSVLADATVVLCVNAPTPDILSLLPPSAALIGLLSPLQNSTQQTQNTAPIIKFSLEKLPRTTRAQAMDVLSSQANLAGYVAVLVAANHYPKLFPMLMTAAGTIKAARVLVLGAGVAGLQAIATAKRLGAVVEVFDVRAAAKEQVESLGAKFIEVPLTDAEKELAKGQGGYAKEMTSDYQQRQSELIAKHVQRADVVITTALIPGKPAPKLISRQMVETMKAGSVIVDLAAGSSLNAAMEPVGAGNCELSQAHQTVVHQGVSVIGANHLPSNVAQDASQLYARNVFEFLRLMINDQGVFNPDVDDELVRATRWV